jgi:hypothetical protein
LVRLVVNVNVQAVDDAVVGAAGRFSILSVQCVRPRERRLDNKVPIPAAVQRTVR